MSDPTKKPVKAQKKQKVYKPKPPTEILLSSLQEKYLETKDPKVWEEMFNIMVVYARSLTLKQNKGKVYLEPDHITAVATDAAMKIMERYTRGDGFYIEKSFGGLLYWKVVESLYGDYEEDVHLSLNHVVSQDSGSKTEFGDLQDKIGFSTLANMHSYEPDYLPSNTKAVQKIIKEVLYEYDLATDSYRLWLLGRAFLLLNLRKSKIRQAPALFKKFTPLTKKEEEVLDLLLLEVRTRLSENL